MRLVKLYKDFVIIRLKELAQSRINILIGFLAFFFSQIGGILFLQLIFAKIPHINGWSFYEILFVYGFSQIPRGIDHLYSDYIWIIAQRAIINGDFDRYLLRPLPILFQVIVERVQLDALGEIIIGIVIVVIALQNLFITFDLVSIIIFIITVILATILYTSIKLICASLAFFMKNSMSILQTVYNTSDFVKYPISIYPNFIRFILVYIIPFAFTSVMPASILLERTPMLKSILQMSIIVLVVAFLALFIWKKGIRNYESSGN